MKNFQKARFKLTLWYILITAFLLLIFSFAAIQAEKRAFTKIQQALSNPAQRPKLTALLETSILEFEKNFKNRLIIFDLILFLLASGSSYLLSGRTLKPISEMVKQQEEFSADASHELRTPLATIDVEIEALRRSEKNLPLKYKKIFLSIQEEISRMRDIVEGLLILVRSNYVDAGASWQTVNLSQLAEETVKQMQPLAREKNIALQLTSEPQLTVYGNSDQLKQVIIILLDNAIKYSPPTGEAGPPADKVMVTTDLAENCVNLTVQDSGVGITQKDLPHIFDRFYRGSTSSSLERGAGIGLTIAKKIMENHKGRILVDSQPNQGSTFTLQLPRIS